jgi:ankyrin repeat protein
MGCFPEKILKVIKLLTKFERNIDTKDADGRTALHYAAVTGFVGAVRHLVREGSDWRIKDKKWFHTIDHGTKSCNAQR